MRYIVSREQIVNNEDIVDLQIYAGALTGNKLLKTFQKFKTFFRPDEDTERV